ncbi:MAG: NADH-quinone oxidoreductase subunit C [Rickettsiaceae bacterium]|nr:NADH-quinone oxidoreductase subunit C [Rickettsiaceae bacterium]
MDEILNSNPFGVKVIKNFDYTHLETNPENIIKLLKSLKETKGLRFTILTDLFAVDFLERDKRFEIVYNLLSLEHNNRIIVKTSVCEKEMMPSASKIFSSSIWYEREIFDMFGVKFSGNPDLRRILTDYGFSGHPLRKDFPVSGYVQVRYDPNAERVVNEPVKLQQAFRDFEFTTPWQGPSYNMPVNDGAPQTPALKTKN